MADSKNIGFFNQILSKQNFYSRKKHLILTISGFLISQKNLYPELKKY